jgi:two-component system LytT family response regulator/two-component system response regulator AlgR
MNAPRPLRIALADDEPLARERLARMLVQQGCEVVRACRDGEETLALLQASPNLDALFLDVQMPGGTGLEILAERPDAPPVVFVSAHSEHAVRAFELAALDYLMKPVVPERLALSLARVREGRIPRPTLATMQALGAVPGERFPVRAGGGHVFLDLRKVGYFEVERNVVWAWSGGTRFRTTWTTLGEVEAAFPASRLVRVQRDLLLRPEAVLGLRPLMGNRVAARIAESVELSVSRTATPKLKALLGLDKR